MAALCLLCFFWRLGTAGLFDFNEGLYVEAAREMVLRGDFVTGRVNGVPFYDKPPLALWAAAAGFALFGFHEWVARLPVAVASSLAAFATYWLGRRISRRTGLLAAAFFALNPIVLGTARQMTMDLHQTWWVTAAILCAYEAVSGRAQAGRERLWWAGFWVSCGLGFMAKSFPGLLPVPVVLAYLWLREGGPPLAQVRALLRVRPLLGIVALAAVVGPWHLAAYLKDRDYFVSEYWTLHHVGILKGTEFGHAQPIWYYVPVLLVAFFPWSLLLPLAMRPVACDDSHGAEALRMARAWAVVGFVLFSLMRSKLVSYLLPVFPALAIVAAQGVDAALRTAKEHGRDCARPIALAMTAAGFMAVVVAAAGLSWLSSHAPRQTDPEAVQLLTPAMMAYGHVALLTMAGGLCLAAIVAWYRSMYGVWLAIGTMAAFVALTWEMGLPAYDRAVNAPLRRIAACATRAVPPDGRLIVHIGRPRRPSVFFYLPDGMLLGPLPANPRQGLLTEAWEPETVRAAVRQHGVSYVLADYRHGLKTFERGFIWAEICREGRWALFRVTPEANAR